MPSEPLLKGTILVAVLFRTLDSYRIFDLFWALSNRELESLSTFVYKSVRVSQLLFAQGAGACQRLGEARVAAVELGELALARAVRIASRSTAGRPSGRSRSPASRSAPTMPGATA